MKTTFVISRFPNIVLKGKGIVAHEVFSNLDRGSGNASAERHALLGSPAQSAASLEEPSSMKIPAGENSGRLLSNHIAVLDNLCAYAYSVTGNT